MMVEFMGRWASKKPKTKQDKKDDYIQSLINKSLDEDDEDEKRQSEIVFTYDPICLNLDNIDEFVRLDKQHVQLNMLTGRMYVIRISFNEFEELYQELTKRKIVRVDFTPNSMFIQAGIEVNESKYREENINLTPDP